MLGFFSDHFLFGVVTAWMNLQRINGLSGPTAYNPEFRLPTCELGILRVGPVAPVGIGAV